ncbi:MAG: DNA polymerase [Terriglobia bacterium]
MRIAVIDLETDPFKYGRLPLPFAAGFYDGKDYRYFWGDDCVVQLLAFLKAYPTPLIIYAHNGGRFDFWYLSHVIADPVLFIDSRLVKASLFHHEIRDSFKILPVPLAQLNKDEIDYAHMERGRRERYKAEILSYLKTDCYSLFDGVKRFIMRHGDVLTIGAAAMKELRKTYKVEHITPAQDATYRQYFHGGRCECFEVGPLRGDKPWKLYDVNSLYPDCMARYLHPIGAADYMCSEIPDAPFFLARICARSKGAFPFRTKEGLTFPHGHFEFWVTSHEIHMALKLQLAEITQVIEVHAWDNVRTFDKFVYPLDREKIDAETRGDKAGRTIAKLTENNAYGKFATDPTKFKEFKLFGSIAECEAAGFKFDGELGERIIGALPIVPIPRQYYNVATAASVTGAGRSIFMHAWASADRAAYGDTDSAWCQELPLELDQKKLGAWKLETECDTLYIAGKKLYAAHKGRARIGSKKWIDGFYADPGENTKPIKCASKGVRMKPEQIAQVALGETIRVPIDAPSLRIGQDAKFIAREIVQRVKVA